MRAAGAQRLKAWVGRALLGGIVVAAAGGVLWYRSLGGDVAPVKPRLAEEAPGKADMVTRDFRHVETRLDRTVWVLEAKRAEMFEETAMLRNVKITWYGEPGQLPVVITSRTGRVDFHSGNAVLSGAVLAVRSDGASLATERLAWNDRAKRLSAPLPVLIRTETFNLRGARMVANVRGQWVRVSGRVRGELLPARPAGAAATGEGRREDS